MTDDNANLGRIVDAIERAPVLAGEGAEPETRLSQDGYDESLAGDELGASDGGDVPFDPAVVEACSRLDHSDTDNAHRLLKHFGGDIVVLAQEKAKTPAFVTWAGTHWDIAGGGMASRAIAQKIGALISLEADALSQTPQEARDIAEGVKAKSEREALDEKMAESEATATKDQVRRRGELTALIAAGETARAELNKRKVARRKFGVSSKNRSRIEAMLECSAPHMLWQPEGFNADPYVFATHGHTLRFKRELDLECPDPEVTRYKWSLDATDGHSREDYITHLVPVDYDREATAPKWRAFLDRFLPNPDVRRFVRTYSGIGLLGISVQRIVFHYGSGANGKSVFMETLIRALGGLAAGLPAESITGDTQRGSGQASPDLARLYGVRTLRVLELPADKPLDEALIKKLTGGEKIPVRDLFSGYFEFKPIFTGHMSGNGYPKIDGTDNGIWRRINVVEWPVQLADEEQREFEDVLADFAPEYPGILNWLIGGALTFLREGLVIPDAVRAATKEYRDEMDPVGEFVAACVKMAPGMSVTARQMYDDYCAWSVANAKKPMFEAKFGRVMKTKLKRDDGRIRRYLDCMTHDVPVVDASARNPDIDGYGH